MPELIGRYRKAFFRNAVPANDCPCYTGESASDHIVHPTPRHTMQNMLSNFSGISSPNAARPSKKSIAIGWEN